ncbi:unnamed protein product [Lasius platythorax]|uniref:Uncharacterized protein n=1 Tax=Lasius platythorax TaxID=488582 RepID=A0AAV2P8K7_9HYME
MRTLFEKSVSQIDAHLTFAFYSNKFPNDNRFIDDECRVIFDRHFRASAQLGFPDDLVCPKNGVNIEYDQKKP